VNGNADGAHRRARGSRLLTVVLAGGLAVAVGAALLRMFGTGGSRWSFQVLSFTPYFLVGAAVLGLLGLLTRRWRICAGAVLAAGALGAGVLPRAVADAQPDATGPELTVAGANLYYGRVDAGAVVDLVRSHEVDVLSVQELTPQAVAALGAAGLWELLPYRILRPEPRAAGTGLASRYPLRNGRRRTLPTTGNRPPWSICPVCRTSRWSPCTPSLRSAWSSPPGGARNSPTCPRR
jgi:hypothetical protein